MLEVGGREQEEAERQTPSDLKILLLPFFFHRLKGGEGKRSSKEGLEDTAHFQTFLAF